MLSGRGGGALRGRIRPPRRHVNSGNADNFEHNWEKLKSALSDIHSKNASGLAFEQLYRHSYKIVLNKEGQRLYDCVLAFEKDWFQSRVIPPIKSLITPNLVSITLDNVPGISVIERRSVGEKFLKAMRASWEEHNGAMNMFADILMYLDRGTTGQNLDRPSIYAATIGLFRDSILQAQFPTHSQNNPESVVFDIFNATILDQINMEREGDVIDQALIRSCIVMLETLHETNDEIESDKLYLTVFEQEFLSVSRGFYQSECEKLLRESDASAWLRHTRRRLREEADRCQTTISMVTRPKIATVVEEELISTHLAEFMNLDGSGFRSMIDNDRVEDLGILYELVGLVDKKMVALRTALSNRVVELGHEIEKTLRATDFSLPTTAAAEEEGGADGADKPKKAPNAAAQQTAAAIKWVDDVLGLKDRFDRLWRDCFGEDLILQTALTKSFSDFINSFDRSSEFVSLFIDDALKRGIKGMTEAEIEVVLEKAITLLRYLSEKDKFELYYQKHLARRLLQQKSESQEVETEMISRMKREMGNAFTHKFENMFKDMNLSREATDSYRSHIRNLGAANEKQIELGINVLGGNNWPKEVMGRHSGLGEARADLNYPPEIKSLQDSFSKFYVKEKVGRKLTWIGSAGNADIRCVFPKIADKTTGPLSKERRYEINTSTQGMVVLLLFNDLTEGEWLTFDDIQAQTNIAQADLVNTLTSLSVVKVTKVLLKDPATKAVAKPGDKFSFNREFVSKSIKIKMPIVNAANKVENEEERKETDNKALETRKYVIDAAVVRIMKARKALSHSQLITDVLSQLASQFKPEVPLIKQRIEDLIGREYLERAENGDGAPAYQYVA